MVRVGLVGCGTIGSRLARCLQREYPGTAKVTALHDQDPRRAAALQRRLVSRPRIVSLPQLIRSSQLILEAASPAVVPRLVPAALRQHREVLVMSVGGLLRTRGWQALARRSRGKVYIPSGALAGLDGVQAMAVGKIRRVTLTTRKPPRALLGAGTGRRARRPVSVFVGSAQDVVKAFPSNTNVAAALTLAAGISGRRTRVRVVADPTIRANVHEVRVEADCGSLTCRVANRPSANPKTSELAVRSAVVMVRRLFEPVVIGT